MSSPVYLKVVVFIGCVCRAVGNALAFNGERYTHAAADTETGEATLRIASYHFM
jgi:hypothetical protein